VLADVFDLRVAVLSTLVSFGGGWSCCARCGGILLLKVAKPHGGRGLPGVLGAGRMPGCFLVLLT